MTDAREPRIDELLPVLERLDRILSRAVRRLVERVGDQAAANPFRGLYISASDATHMAEGAPWSPLLGVAEGEPPLMAVLDPASRLAVLAAERGLTSFDLDVLAIALAPEVDLGYGRLYAFLQDDVSHRRPSVDFALNLLCPTIQAKMARREHFATDAPMIAGDVLELVCDPAGPPGPLLARVLEVDDALVRHLFGIGGADPELRHAGVLVETADEQRPMPRADVGQLAPLVLEARSTRTPLRLYFSGPAAGDKRRAALWLAGRAQAPLLVMKLGELSSTTEDLWTAARRLLRAARLQDAVVLADEVDALDDDGARALSAALAGYRGPVIVAGSADRPTRPAGLDGLLRVAFPVPGHEQRRRSWEAAVDAQATTIAVGDADLLAGRFRLTHDAIVEAVAAAACAARMREPGTPPTLDELFAAARDRSDSALAAVARKVEPNTTWDQLALPDDTVALLREMCQQIAERPKVLDAWGFGKRLSLGKGVSALFAGPSGTGKTTAAEIIGRELGLDLYRIDLASVVSKYIGETEKNLERIFTAAEDANAILFFDEADALFGKRSEVKDAHDRYANIEISYLVQRMEQYDGVVILATNLRQNMDEAFVRRLQFVIEFEFPDEEQRARIWPLLFSPEAERDADIDFEQLARRFRITGGNIKNVVLGAAYLAAGEREPIGTRHLLRALKREYHKMGRVLAESDLEPFRELVAR